MGLTVGIGVRGWFWEDDSTPQWETFLRSVVATGCTERVRDLDVELSSDLTLTTPIYEAYRADDGEVRGRYLSAEERQPIISDVLTTYEEYDSWAGFSWDQLEENGAFDVQSINVRMDVQDTWKFEVMVDGARHRIRDLESSAANYGAPSEQCRVAVALHVPAANHRLIVKAV